MKNLQRLLRLLQMQFPRYENYKYDHFLQWCRTAAQAHHLPLKDLTKNDYLLNWYDQQWEDYVEIPFLNDMVDFDHIRDYEAYRSLLETYPDTIYKYYPGALFTAIKNARNARAKTENTNAHE